MSSQPPPQVYGADEVNAVVLDPGSQRTAFGYAGYDFPTLVLPSRYGQLTENDIVHRRFDENSLDFPHKGQFEINPTVKDGVVVDWDGMEDQCKFMFDRLKVDPSEQPLLMTESTLNSYENKSKALELMLEKNNFCAFYLAKQPSCISFANGRPNCLIVDIGHDVTMITPVVDGLCLHRQVLGSHYGGRFLSEQLNQIMQSKGCTVDPQYKIKSKTAKYIDSQDSQPDCAFKEFDFEITPSFDRYHREKVLHEMKETVVECSDADRESAEGPKRYFELPNGLNVPLTQRERRQIGNSLFEPGNAFARDKLTGFSMDEDGDINRLAGPPAGELHAKEYVPLRRTLGIRNPEDDEFDEMEVDSKTSTRNMAGLSQLVHRSLLQLDIDLKPQLANNIIVTGAASFIPGLTERLYQELCYLNPGLKIRVNASGNGIERKYSSWVGGSILASLGTFHQLWVSKQEYEEEGVDRLVTSRFR